jgi:hypothetical protein
MQKANEHWLKLHFLLPQERMKSESMGSKPLNPLGAYVTNLLKQKKKDNAQ